jgi:hypothetical protein
MNIFAFRVLWSVYVQIWLSGFNYIVSESTSCFIIQIEVTTETLPVMYSNSLVELQHSLWLNCSSQSDMLTTSGVFYKIILN